MSQAPRPRQSHYATVVAVFCALLLISNIGAVKLIDISGLVFDGGAILFPLTYVVGDVLTEIYGLQRARRAIFTALALQALAAGTFWAVTVLPPADGWNMQEAYASVVGFVPRIVFASLCAFIVGELLNSYVLVWIRRRTQGQKLWLRLIGSTVVGEFADTLVFCTVAFFGVITGAEFLNYVITGYLYKTLLEVLLLPITYRVVAYLRQHDVEYTPA